MTFSIKAIVEDARVKRLAVEAELASTLEISAPVAVIVVAAQLYARHHLPQAPAMVLILGALLGSGVFHALQRKGVTGLVLALRQGLIVGWAAAALISALNPSAPLPRIIGDLWMLGIWGYLVPASFLCMTAPDASPNAADPARRVFDNILASGIPAQA